MTVSFNCVLSTTYEMTPLSEYFLVHFRNRRLRIYLRLSTMANLQRTTVTLRIATLKRIGILRALLPQWARRNLEGSLSMANTKNAPGWELSLGFEMWLSSRTSTQHPLSYFLNRGKLPSSLVLSIHRPDHVCAFWVRRKSQVKESWDCLDTGGRNT